MIKWDDIILTLENGERITHNPSRWNLSNPEYKKIYSQWEDANFNMSSICWINYYPGEHFDQTIVKEVENHLRITSHRAWISQIDPGYFAPWHWDVDDNIDDYLSKGKIKRFSIFIGNPHPAHFFTTDSLVFSNTPTGTIYKWENYNSWHAGANAGITPKYMFHILGY